MSKLEILVTNDDSIDSNGLHVLAELLKPFGNVTVIAPAEPQSGMSAAVSLGKHIYYKELHKEEGFSVGSLSGSPVTCIKFGLMRFFSGRLPDLIVSGINHGSNASAAAVYSGTLGATAEGALHGICSFGVSIDNHSQDADFSNIRKILPKLVKMIINTPPKPGIYLNINFPDIPYDKIKGIFMASQGSGLWVKEFNPVPPPEGETLEDGTECYSMTGSFEDLPENLPTADHRMMEKGYITIVPHNVDSTDYTEMKRLSQAWNL